MIRVLVSIFLVFASLSARAEISISEVNTPGGIGAWLVEDHSLPFVALEIRFRGGASLDPVGRRGATHMMVGLLEEGAGDMDAQAFASAVDDLAANFEYDVNNDSISISARFLTENRDKAVSLLRESITAPRFDEDAMERVRAQISSIINSDLSDPEEAAWHSFSEMVYGSHPYGSPIEGDLPTLQSLNRDDLISAHNAALARDRVYVGAVGDIGTVELAKLLDALLGDLPEKGGPLPPAASPNLTGGTIVREFDTPQSVAYFAQPGIHRDHPDFFAAFILAHIIGDPGLESVLMREVRVKRGLTYSIYSYLANQDLAEIWIGTTSSANDRVAEAVDVIRAEWERISREGVTREQFDAAVTYLTGAYPLRFDGNGRIANIVVGMQMDDLPLDYISTRNDKIRAVTLKDVNNVAKELLDPDSLTFVVTGKPAGLELSTD
ncbi:MAG: pitrilysin family protein [Roseovarius sp.]|nr:pitrilysin family protein [Roseovarius sp.]MCY4292074.1 pitrilysin family protein [Roseovarius sp.]